MKHKQATFLFILTIFVSLPALGGQGIGDLSVSIQQSGNPVNAEKTTNDRYRIALSRKPFEISYHAKEIGICVSTSPDVFEKAKVNTNTDSDFSSCLFLYKAFGMSPKGGTLFADMGGGNWLNKAHGARKGKGGRNVYQVASFSGKETGDLPLTRITRPMYLAIWEDLNSNRIIDQGELARVELVFK